MRSALKMILCLGVVASLGACYTPRDHFDVFFNQAMPAAPADINWDEATPMTLSVQDNAFSPMIIHFEAGKPYRLTIENKDDTSRIFFARGFFDNVQLASLSDMKEGANVTELDSIGLGPNSKREISFVAGTIGEYRFEDSFPGGSCPLVPGRGFLQGVYGVAYIKAPYDITPIKNIREQKQ